MAHLTMQEAKVSTFFISLVSGVCLSGALTRVFSHGHFEAGSIIGLVLGCFFLVFAIIHVGLEG